MSQPVAIKGVKSGIVLKLDSRMDFNELLPLIKEKFSASASFFGSAGMALSIEGRQVSEAETTRIIEIIESNTSMKIGAVFTNDELLEKKFSDALRQNGVSSKDAEAERRLGRLEKENAALAAALRQNAAADSASAEIYIGTLRSGSSYACRGSLLLLGDVKQGAEVVAGGSIFVLGNLLGNVTAGAMGDDKAFVMALHLDPLQVRISDALAISEDKDATQKSKKRSIFNRPESDKGTPEVAVFSDGHIVIKKFDRTFLNSTEFLKAFANREENINE